MFLDISVGILLSIGASQYFNIELTLTLVLISVLFALLPDIDFLWRFFRYRVISQSHREILHHPLIFFTAGAVVSFFLNKIIGVLFISATLWHFLNDTIFLGLGVQWFWPFSNKYFNLFGIFGYQTPDKPKLPFKLFYIWAPGQIKEIEQKYGDPNWFRNIYLKPHLLAIIEYLIFIFSVILLIFYVR
jgi:hypothetical protein